MILYIFDTALRQCALCLKYICRPLVVKCGRDKLLCKICKLYNTEHTLQSVTEITAIHTLYCQVVCILQCH